MAAQDMTQLKVQMVLDLITSLRDSHRLHDAVLTAVAELPRVGDPLEGSFAIVMAPADVPACLGVLGQGG